MNLNIIGRSSAQHSRLIVACKLVYPSLNRQSLSSQSMTLSTRTRWFYFHSRSVPVPSQWHSRLISLVLFRDFVRARSFKLCRNLTLHGVYIFVVGLMTLIVSRSHVCQKYKLQIVLFDSHKKCECVIISVRPGRPVKCPCVAKTLPLQFSRTL